LVKNLDGEYFSTGRLLANHRCYGRPMAEPIQIIGLLGSIWEDGYTACDCINVRMRGMHSAIDHGDS